MDSLSPNPENPLPLKTISESGKAPKTRLSSARDAQALFWILHEAALPRMSKAAVIKGMFDGNPPYNAQKLRQAGQAWRPNFNTLEGASRLESAKVPYYDLLTSAPLLAECATDVSTNEVDSAAATRIRSKHFDTMLRSYDGFDHQFWTMFTDYIGFNKGFLWFPKPDSWHFKHLPWWRVYFPDGTSTDPDEWEVFAIEHRWPAHKLFGFIRDENAAKAAGWNQKQVLRAIRRACPDDIGKQYDDPMAIQRAMRDNDLYLSAKIGTISSASIYVREFNGKWSRMMVETYHEKRSQSPSGAQSQEDRAQSRGFKGEEDAKIKDNDWLYFKADVAENVYQIMCPFVYEANDGSITEISGLGKRIVSAMQVKDRMRNEQVSNVFLRTSINLQASTGGGQAKAAAVQLGGGVNVIPPGYQVQPATIFGDIEGTLAVNNDLDRMIDTNTGTYRPTFEKPQGNPESATASQIRFSQSQILTNSAVSRFYVQSDKFYDEVYRRATMELPESAGKKDAGIKAALEFQKSCKEEGLSKEQIKERKPGYIRAMRTIGNGSPMMRQQAVAALGQVVPFLGPRGLQNWKIDYVSAYGGQQAVARLLPPEDAAQIPTRDDYDAVGENADMKLGTEVLFADWQNHEQHAKVHLTAALGAVQAVQQGADPSTAFTFLQIAMPHIGQHISKVPREQVRKQLEAAYKEVAQGAKVVFQAAEKQMQQGSKASGLNFEQQLEAQKVQHDIQLKEAKTKAQIQQRQQKQLHDMEMDKVRLQHETQMSDARTASEIQRGTAKTASEIEMQRAKAEAAKANEGKGDGSNQ